MIVSNYDIACGGVYCMAFIRGAAGGATVNAKKQRKAQVDCRHTLKERQPQGLEKSSGTKAKD